MHSRQTLENAQKLQNITGKRITEQVWIYS